jgi:PAS domain S-box-containing protein
MQLPQMVRINYAIRAGSFGYSFLVLGIHGAERGFGALFFAALAVQFLAYPHLVYLLARRSAQPRHVERNALYLDAALLGVWIGALHFPLWLAYSALFSITLNAMVVFGPVRGAWAVAAFGGGAAVAMAMAGMQVFAETSRVVTTLCFLGSFAYSCAVGAVVYQLRSRVHESEERYRLLAENAADLVALVDRDARWIYASPSFAAVLSREDLVEGADAFVRAHPDDASEARIALLRSAASGKPRDLSLRLVDSAGRMRQYRGHVQPVKGEALPAARLVLALSDVTDLRASEEQLLIAGHALEGMTEAIMITAADGTIVSVNRAFSHITGHARDEVLGQPEKAVRSGLAPDSFYDQAYATVHRDNYWSGTIWNRRKNGSVYREWRSIRPVKEAAGQGAHGAVTHYVHVFYEVGVPRNGVHSGAGGNLS